MKSMHWKRVIIYSSITSATFYIVAFAYFWLQPVPPMRCMNELSELADIALQEYKEGRTKAFTQDMYFNEETKQWCYFDEED
jgi:hypothetical protein